MSENPLQAYGRWIASVSNDWETSVLDLAYRELIDTVAVMIPGAMTPVACKVRNRVRQWGTGSCTVVGNPERLPLPWSALHNATAGHALDFDDNFDPPKAHVSTVLWPAILALADEFEYSPGQCLDAYIVALQIQGRIGQGLNPPHRKRGWHATATTGALGAAAAAARLLGLDAEKSAMALSLGTSVAGGFMSQFGSMAKPLHAGNAAKGGILSALFAQDGLTAGWHTLDGPTGMNTLMVGPDREELRAAIGEPEHGQTLTFETRSIGEPLLISEHLFRVKRFPTCGSAHRALDVVLMLRDEHGFRADEVERVDVTAPAMHLKNLMYQRPETGLEGKFSMEYPIACAIIGGGCKLEDFTDAAVSRPEHRQFMERVYRHPVDKPETEMDTTVRITLTDGRVLEKSIFMPLGSKVAPFSNDQYWAKFDQCARGVMEPGALEQLKHALENFRSLSTASEMTQCMGVALSPEPSLQLS